MNIALNMDVPRQVLSAIQEEEPEENVSKAGSLPVLDTGPSRSLPEQNDEGKDQGASEPVAMTKVMSMPVRGSGGGMALSGYPLVSRRRRGLTTDDLCAAAKQQQQPLKTKEANAGGSSQGSSGRSSEGPKEADVALPSGSGVQRKRLGSTEAIILQAPEEAAPVEEQAARPTSGGEEPTGGISSSGGEEPTGGISSGAARPSPIFTRRRSAFERFDAAGHEAEKAVENWRGNGLDDDDDDDFADFGEDVFDSLLEQNPKAPPDFLSPGEREGLDMAATPSLAGIISPRSPRRGVSERHLSLRNDSLRYFGEDDGDVEVCSPKRGTSHTWTGSRHRSMPMESPRPKQEDRNEFQKKHATTGDASRRPAMTTRELATAAKTISQAIEKQRTLRMATTRAGKPVPSACTGKTVPSACPDESINQRVKRLVEVYRSESEGRESNKEQAGTGKQPPASMDAQRAHDKSTGCTLS